MGQENIEIEATQLENTGKKPVNTLIASELCIVIILFDLNKK